MSPYFYAIIIDNILIGKDKGATIENVSEKFKVLGLKDLYAILPFGKTKIMQLIHSGELPVVKVGRDYITTANKIENWIEENIGEELYYS